MSKHLMRRIFMFFTGLFLIGALNTSFAADKHKVVYHLGDKDKIEFALRNISNHIEGVGGPDNIDIVLVVIGGAIDGIKTSVADEKIKTALSKLSGQGVHLEACGNTMRHMKLELSDLVSGFSRRDEGGVVRLMELEEKGYSYIRP